MHITPLYNLGTAFVLSAALGEDDLMLVVQPYVWNNFDWDVFDSVEHRVYFKTCNATVPVRKYHKLHHYGQVSNWYGKIPDACPRDCVDFELQPAPLPLAPTRACNELARPKFTMCYTAMANSDTPRLGLHSAYRLALHNIAYHKLHFGVDNAVVYVRNDDKHIVQLLEGARDNNAVRIIRVNATYANNPYNGYVGSRIIDMQAWLENDCLVRFKTSNLLRTIDFDEFMYSVAPLDLEKGDYDYVYAKGYDWQLLPALSPLHSLYRTRDMPPRYFKSVMRPKRIAVTWVHLPVNCFGKFCVEGQKNTMHYAHFRFAQKSEKELVYDTRFQEVARKTDALVCAWTKCHPNTQHYLPTALAISI